MKTKRLNKKEIFIICISVLVLVFIVHNLVGFFFKKNLYLVNDISKIKNEINVNALVLKDEYIYLNDVETKVAEKVKYPVGSNVINIPKEVNLQMSTKYIDDKLNDLEINHSDKTTKNFEIKDTDIKTLSNSIRNRNFDDKFLVEYDKKKNITEEEYFHLKKELEILKEVLNSKSTTVKTTVSGVLNSDVDNYENLVGYNSSNIIGNDFYLRDLDENYSMKGLSIVDSMNLSLLFDVESSKFNRNLKANDEIEITFGKNNYSAHIKDIKQNDGIITIVCDMNDGINDLINKRFIPITVIDKKTKVFKIPKKSILTRDSIEGVYIKKETGIIKFVTVKVLKADDKFAYVSTGTDGEIDVNNRKVKTLELYDYIVKNPRFVKEGELLK